MIRVHNHLCVNMCVLWCERRVCLRVCVCARLRALPVARILCVFVWVCVCVGGGEFARCERESLGESDYSYVFVHIRERETFKREPGGEWLFICACTHPRERDIQTYSVFCNIVRHHHVTLLSAGQYSVSLMRTHDRFVRRSAAFKSGDLLRALWASIAIITPVHATRCMHACLQFDNNPVCSSLIYEVTPIFYGHYIYLWTIKKESGLVKACNWR